MINLHWRGLPWQRSQGWGNELDGTQIERWGWNPFSIKGWGRYGGGWGFALGIKVSSDFRDILIQFGLGEVCVRIGGPFYKGV